MTYRIMRRFSLAAIAVVLGACDIDLVEVEPDDGAQPSTSIPPALTIQLKTDEMSGHLEYVVIVRPGRMDDGEIRRAVTDTLYVDGFGFTPDSVGENGEMTYFAGYHPPPTTGIRIRPPRLNGMFGPPPEIEIEPLRVIVEDTLVFREDSAVTFELMGVGEGGKEGVTELWTWMMRIQSLQDDNVVNLASNQRPPPTLTLSTTMVPVGSGRGTLKFAAQGTKTYVRMTSLDLEYDVGISRTVTMMVPYRIDRQHGDTP